MGTKNNPGRFDCYGNAEPDEPIFVLLGRLGLEHEALVRSQLGVPVVKMSREELLELYPHPRRR